MKKIKFIVKKNRFLPISRIDNHYCVRIASICFSHKKPKIHC